MIKWFLEMLAMAILIIFFYMLFSGLRGCAEYTYRGIEIRRAADEGSIRGNEIPREQGDRDRR